MENLKLWFMHLLAKKPKSTVIYEIDLTKKYIVAFDEFIPDVTFEKIKTDIDQFAKSDKTFLLIRGANGNVRLLRRED